MGGAIPQQITTKIAQKLAIRVLIETGTYKGATTIWAANHFDRVITVEAFRERHEKTKAAWGALHPNIEWVFGDSRTALAEILKNISEPCIFWLDAHWIGNSVTAYEQQDECPLREELEAINAHPLADYHVILIDDARLFQNPPPYPHHPEQWPTIQEVGKLLTARPRLMTIKDDVIYGIPKGYGITL